MNLIEPTPWDLRFRLFRIPVRVHPTFWLFSLLMGWSYERYGFQYVFLWVVCTFVSVLIHELGHILAGLWGGVRGEVILYSMGGVAVGHYERLRRWQRIVLYLAGPAVGFALYGLLKLIQWQRYAIFPDADALPIRLTFQMLLFMNLFWNLINLVPVMPLDGGQVMREFTTGISPRRGMYYAQVISVVAALAVVAWSIYRIQRPLIWYPSVDPMFMAILFGLMGVQAFFELRRY